MASPVHDRLLFLVGARRSGTNWLQRILAAHPGVVVVPPETHVFNLGVKPLSERFQHANPGSLMMGTMFVEREHFVEGVRGLLDRAFADNLERLGGDARYVLERTPWHVYDLELIAEVYPDARAIHIIRDGRAVARSLMAMEWGPDTMEEAAEEWRSSVESGRRGMSAFGPERYREVIYEELLADPGKGIDPLFAWLGLELDDATRERILLEAAGEFNVDPGSPGIRADKWRGALSNRDLATFQRIAGEQMAALGYPLDEVGTGRGAREAVAAPLRAARAAASRLRHPRAEARKVVERAGARRLLQTLEANYAIVERLEKALDRGDRDDVRALLAPKIRVQIDDGADGRERRGAEAEAALLDFYAEHRGARQLAGQVHSSPGMFTTVSVYELATAERWVRVAVFDVAADGTVSNAALHRFPLAAPAADEAAGPPEPVEVSPD